MCELDRDHQGDFFGNGLTLALVSSARTRAAITKEDVTSLAEEEIDSTTSVVVWKVFNVPELILEITSPVFVQGQFRTNARVVKTIELNIP